MTAASSSPTPFPAKVWRLTAFMAALFTIAVGAAMIVAHLEHRSSDPWKSPTLLELKEQLRAEPRNDALKTQIRELDLHLRERYFRLLSFKSSGVYLLFGGAVMFLIAGAQVMRINQRPPMPRQNPLAAELLARSRRGSRLAIAGCGTVAAMTFLAVAFSSKSPLPAGPLEAAGLFETNAETNAGPAVADCATDEELLADWPGFRGFDGSGVTIHTNLPEKLDEADVLWKTPSPAPGFNSPLIFGNRVFLTGGDAKKREVFCLDASTGATLWLKPVDKVPGSPAQVPEIPEMTGYCPSTAATDGRRVYALFANGDLAAFTLEGERIWARHLGTPKNAYGHATSLRTWQDRVIIQMDQGEAEDHLSKLLALDGKTGTSVWEKARPVGASWTTPIVVPAAGKTQIVTLALPWIIAYNAADGAELWRSESLEGEVTPSAVLANDLIYAVSPSTKLMAIRPDGSGDVTKTHTAWNVEEYFPDISSPASNGELVFTVTSGGLLACFDAKDGKKVWEHDFESEVHASPALAGNRVYVLTSKGDVVVAEAGREFKELSRTRLDDAFYASPAFTDGKIILRGNKHVWAFGAKK